MRRRASVESVRRAGYGFAKGQISQSPEVEEFRKC